MKYKGVFNSSLSRVNHNADMSKAYKRSMWPPPAVCDCVKFQTAIPELVICREAPKADYQKVTTGHAESQLEMCKENPFAFERL